MMIWYKNLLAYTRMVDITIESEAWGHGALAAEDRLEKSSFKFGLEDTDEFKLSNGIRKAISDLRASGVEATGREERLGIRICDGVTGGAGKW